MIEIKRVTDSDIEPEGVELGDRPEGIEIDLGAKNHVLLWRGREKNRPRRAKENGGSVFREVDIVIVVDAHRRAEAELNRAHLQIIRDLVDRLPPRLRGCFTRE